MAHKSGNDEQPSCVLMCGNIGLLDQETIVSVTRYYRLVVVGKNDFGGKTRKAVNKRLYFYSEEPDSEDFARIVYAYSPDVIWYFSGYADGGDGLVNEKKKIENIYKQCSINEVSKLIIVSSINSLNYTEKEYCSDRAFNCAQMEMQLSYLASKDMVKTVILRIPYVALKINRSNYLGNVFKAVAERGEVKLPYNETQFVDFISAHNLAELLISVTEETIDEAGAYAVTSGFRHNYSEFGDGLKKCKSGLKVDYANESYFDIVLNEKAESENIRRNYGYVATDDCISNLPELFRNFLKSNEKKSSLREKADRIMTKLTKNTNMILEMAILFVVMEVLLRFTSESIYFRFVDLRLFFVVIMGVAHGMIPGLFAGLLVCASLVFGYEQAGVPGVMLFYNMDYWLPFAIYLMTGTITGYITSTNNQRITFAEEQVRTLQDKYLFLDNVYMSVIDNKEEYKRQILGYQDSFGKIFEAVEKLNSSVPADIFMNGIDTLEHILDNHTIAIYVLDDNQNYSRLVACSREMMTRLRKSIKVDDIRDVYDVIRTGDTWKNNDFVETLPMYSYGILNGDDVRLMISIYDASPEQLGLYYMNLFTIMCHLIRMSFIHALEYQEAIEKEKYVPGTVILLPEYFEKELESQRKMSEAGVASYMLIRIITDNINSISEHLQSMIRQSDVVGNGKDGKLYLLLTQTNRDIFEIIGKRLEGIQINYEIVEGM